MLIIAGAWFIGAFINGLTGMGGALISMPLISLFVSSKEVILISLITGTMVGSLTMVFYWRYINVRELLGFWIPAIPGIAVGVWTLKVVDISLLELLLCILIVVQLIHDCLGVCMASRAAMKYVCGFLAGFFGGAIGINGPIIAIYASLMCMEKNKARGFFASATATSYISIGVVAGNGLLKEQVLSSCFWVAPSAAIGFLCACPLARRIRQETFHAALLILLGFAALSLFIRILSAFS
ncbi:sulfite exporter TauE/SafE family protein [Mailhella massiliensis]|uniref:Probable membrane transporter protein n=1 Tax=Mailhella massiliensis TaxID=1903261 RepID=A0A921AW37_9BACT|nr:sulfite exporter TauE/SafE family protein [Mailhella massiliensis]HJD97136.1 sulfite exporter TauE/SafE family protein [Mailhella massiliensis]